MIERENNGHVWVHDVDEKLQPVKAEHCGICGVKRTKSSEAVECSGYRLE